MAIRADAVKNHDELFPRHRSELQKAGQGLNSAWRNPAGTEGSWGPSLSLAIIQTMNDNHSRHE